MKTPTELGLEAALNLERLSHASSRVRAARFQGEYAGTLMSLEQVKERCAEVNSQAATYVAKGAIKERFGDITEREREIALAFVQYVTFGRTNS